MSAYQEDSIGPESHMDKQSHIYDQQITRIKMIN